MQDPIEQQQFDRELSAAITTALSLKMEFELYTFRIQSPESFIERTKAILEAFQETISIHE